MPTYGNKSQANLAPCHPELQMLFHYVIQYFDNSVICGFRPISKQQELFKKGRKLVNGIWVVEDEKKIVTYCDGIIKKSDHNVMPSLAVDAVPYPIEWKNINRMRYFVGYVKGIAKMLLEYGQMEYELITGMDWDNDTILRDQRFNDIPHFKLKL